jgi:hypothetical protein
MNLRDKLSIALFILVIFLAIYLLVYIKTESYSCINNPYAYPIKLLEKASGENVSCHCIVVKEDSTINLVLNSTGLFSKPSNLISSGEYSKVNFTALDNFLKEKS